MKKLLPQGFVISWSAAQIYEVAWIRSFSIRMDSTIRAVSAMLATFMSEMALGCLLRGKLADRYDNPFVPLVFRESGIGFFGLLIVPMIYSLDMSLDTENLPDLEFRIVRITFTGKSD